MAAQPVQTMPAADSNLPEVQPRLTLEGKIIASTLRAALSATETLKDVNADPAQKSPAQTAASAWVSPSAV